MSFQAMAAAINIELPAPKKCLLLIMANYAGLNNELWPSLDRLAREAGMSRRSAINYIAYFESIGLVKVTKRKGVKGNQTNLYELVLPSAGAALPSAPDSPHLVQELHLPSAGAAPKPIKEPISIEPITNAKSQGKPAQKKQKRKSRLPENFTLTAEVGRKAIDYWRQHNRDDLVNQVGDTFDQFCAHHRAKGSTMACWDSAWQTWYCNAVKFNRPTGGTPNGPNPNQPRRLSAVERVQQNCDEARRKREAQQRTEGGGFTFDGEVVAEDGEPVRIQVHQSVR